MPTIPNLAPNDALTSGDQFVIYSSNNGDARRVSAGRLATFVESQITVTDDKVTQYAAPSATAFSVQIGAGSVWLVLTPTGGFADGEIVLASSPEDKDEVLVNCTQAVTTFVVDGNGATVTGAPTTLTANDFFRLRFEAVTSTWYRVG